ncbi:L-cysteine desulfidase [Hydrogenispora ethanolica]|uniref:L-cysteine desulfidase n=1 Tax=Hydrogenispora ethanolica TaxID=1082276 RepID=A0A4R1RC12_HYDET|nr:L-serine ammonia-lyase, iron-sulfur-dependent, subunit alpha [Hydrogenispora ethanolica]TCL63296.1 L-cysteine desulfidase [Hydrogenispora ethanolica]
MDIKPLLDREIKLTMGCTDPGTVAYAAAQAASLLPGELAAIRVRLSPNLYKNALYVGIPILKQRGIEHAALLGALIKRPEKKLEVLSLIDETVLRQFALAKERLEISVDYQEFADPLYLEVECRSAGHCVKVVIQGDYDRITQIVCDQELLHTAAAAALPQDAPAGVSWGELYHSALHGGLEELKELGEYEAINRRAAFHGAAGAELCPAADRDIHAMAGVCREYVFRASRMRMSGEPFQIASVAGSGNLGIASMLSVAGLCDCLDAAPERRLRALALSVLTAIYIKSFMDRTTVMCGTAMAGAAGAGAAAAYLFGGDRSAVERAIDTALGTLTGILCDGAKESCAFKVSMAAANGVVDGYMAVRERYIRGASGMITADIDRTIRNIGRINNECMKEVNHSILKIIQNRY